MKKLLFCCWRCCCACRRLAEGARITLTPAGNFSPYAAFEDDCARVIDTGETGLEGVFDIQGNAIIPCEYGSVSDYGVCSYYTVQNENGVNVLGALNAAGEAGGAHGVRRHRLPLREVGHGREARSRPTARTTTMRPSLATRTTSSPPTTSTTLRQAPWLAPWPASR